MESDKDEYFMKALKEGYRARSAYKLIQLNHCFDLFRDVKKVIDLCAAPGSWAQVTSNMLHKYRNITEPNKIQLKSDVKIVAVDLDPIRPIPGVTSLVADITDIKTCVKLMELFQNEKVDLILCDGSHDVSGMVLADFQLHRSLVTACIHIILQTLKDDGSFVAKMFNTWGCPIFIRQLKIFFKEVYVIKPHSSRSESYECFAICKKYRKPKDFNPSQLTPYLDYTYRDFSNLTGIHKLYIPFLVLGYYDINADEFEELRRKYRDELFERNDLAEELFKRNDLSDIKKSWTTNQENMPKQETFAKKLLNKSKFAFDVLKKPFILYLNKNSDIDFYKTIDYRPPKLEVRKESDLEEETTSNQDNFIAKLFESLFIKEKDETSNNLSDEIHPWFIDRNLEDNTCEFEDFDLESILKKTDDELMKILKENNGNVPKNFDISQKFSLLEDPNNEVLELVKERRDLIEEIQQIVEKNEL